METMPKGRQQKIVTRMAHTRWFGTYGGGPATGSDVRLPPQALQNLAPSSLLLPQVGQYMVLMLEPVLPIHHVGVVELLIRLRQVQNALDQGNDWTDYPARHHGDDD